MSTRYRKAIASQAGPESPHPDQLERNARSSNDSTKTASKGPFSGLKKVFAPRGSSLEQRGRDPQAPQTKGGRRQSMESGLHPTQIQPANRDVESNIQTDTDDPSPPGEPEDLTTEEYESLTRLIEGKDGSDPRDQKYPTILRLQNEVAKLELFSSFFQERLGKFEREKRSSDEAYQQRVQTLNKKIQTLYQERDDARRLNDELLDTLPAHPPHADQSTASGKPRALRLQENPEAADLIQRLKHRDDLERQVFTLQSQYTTLEAKNNQLRQELEAAEDDAKLKALECDDLDRSFNASEDANLKLLAQLKKARQQIGVVSERDQDREELNRVHKELDRVRGELDRVVLDRATEIAIVDSYYFDDAYFKTQFCALRNDIKDWANRAFATSLSKDKKKPPPTVVADFSQISTSWETYMDSDRHRPSFVQAFIWKTLFSWVFGGDFWELPSGSKKFQRFLEDKNPRGTSSLLICPTWPTDQNQQKIPLKTRNFSTSGGLPVQGMQFQQAPKPKSNRKLQHQTFANN